IRNLRQLNAQRKQQSDNLRVLEQRRTRAHTELQRHIQGLERQIRSAYAIDRQGYAKMLLNQDDPARVARVLTYYRYFNRARLQQISSITSTLAQLRTVQDEIRTKA
ncbi:MAG: peptidase M23, partial [Burkholderiales bacterium]|nr:peptidase M23 [Burkholderiales bacterium]